MFSSAVVRSGLNLRVVTVFSPHDRALVEIEFYLPVEVGRQISDDFLADLPISRHVVTFSLPYICGVRNKQ
jgi:hypothetical protein